MKRGWPERFRVHPAAGRPQICFARPSFLELVISVNALRNCADLLECRTVSCIRYGKRAKREPTVEPKLYNLTGKAAED